MNLTPKQQAFADAILKGLQPSAAYRSAGYADASVAVVSVRAQEYLKKPNVRRYLSDQRRKLEEKSILSKQAILEKLSEIACDKEATNTDKIRAMERFAKMLGYDAPQKIEAKVEGSLLYRIRKGKTS